MKKIIFITLIIIQTLSFAKSRSTNTYNFRWQKVETNTESSLYYVAGKSKNNFWVQTLDGLLINVQNSKLTLLKSPQKFIITSYYKIGENDFICSATDLNWAGKIYRITNGKWHKYQFSINTPLHQIYKLGNNLYIVGDDGVLLKKNNNNWKAITTPFESHVLSGIVFNNSLYISTRQNGFFRYDGKSFFHYPNSSNLLFKPLKIIKGKVYALSLTGLVYELRKHELIEVKDKFILDFFFPRMIKNHLGYDYRAFINKSGKKFILQFPESYNINSAVSFNDSSFALLSNDGNIYISGNSGKNNFTEVAALYRVDDLPNSTNVGVAVFDANKDNVSDILLTNDSRGNFLGLYKGVKNSPFANLTSTSGLPFNKFKINFFTISDFNKDNLPDIIIEGKPDSLHKLFLYENRGEFEFILKREIILPTDFQTFGIRALSTYDYDNDGDNDIIVTTYYGKNNNPGAIIIYSNGFWGSSFIPDTTLKPLTRKWNSITQFADINNDDKTDLFISNYWASNRIYLNYSNNNSPKYKIINKPFPKSETLISLLCDFDNDGDLDIFSLQNLGKLQLFRNDGHEKFKDVSDIIKYPFADKTPSNLSVGVFNIGDFNNDGFYDIIARIDINGKHTIALLKNNNGKSFSMEPTGIISRNNHITHFSIADIDNDGDLDIYCSSKKHNLLYLNNLDSQNYINIKLQGIKSETEAKGAKVWIFEDGKVDSMQYLLGYQQLGTVDIATNRQNDFTLHFGLGNKKRCDVKVRFLSGKIIFRHHVKAGTTLGISEYSGIYKALLITPGFVYRFVSNTTNQIYFIIIFFSLAFIYFGLRFGYKRNYYSNKTVLIYLLLDLSLIAVAIYISSFSTNEYLKFLVPLGVAILSSVLPLTILVGIQKKSKEEINLQDEKLLQLVMSFSHGKWALRNLNSIILLCQNPSENWRDNEEFKKKLSSRFETFRKLTLPAITEIITIEKTISSLNKDLTTILGTLKEVDNLLPDKISDINYINLSSLSLHLSIIRSGIKEIRDTVFSRFSAYPTDVINNVINETSSLLSYNNIKIEKKKLFSQKIPVLIKSHELANIIDNLLHNSIRFMKNSPVKKIDIVIKKESPKIIISWSNTGEKIPENKFDLIFEQGYSESKSTGRGLFEATKILKKYDGRIYLKSSNDEKTTFIIELNEGIKE